jgi:hypothetical protein
MVAFNCNVLMTNEERWGLVQMAHNDYEQIAASAQACLAEDIGDFPSLKGTAVSFTWDLPKGRYAPPLRWSADFDFPVGATQKDVKAFYADLRHRPPLNKARLGPVLTEETEPVLWTQNGKVYRTPGELVYFDVPKLRWVK